MVPVIEHALAETAKEGWTPSIIVLLQPTSPLRRPDHIRDAVNLLRETNADSVVTVVEIPRHLSPDYVMRIDGGRLMPFLPGGLRITRRQDARPAYSRDGTVYAFRRSTLERCGGIYGDDCRPLLIDVRESLSIDTQDDWEQAERLLAAGR
jgi:CMP-N-acetylneuraminic acid synthetase